MFALLNCARSAALSVIELTMAQIRLIRNVNIENLQKRPNSGAREDAVAAAGRRLKHEADPSAPPGASCEPIAQAPAETFELPILINCSRAASGPTIRGGEVERLRASNLSG
jgi:hypothetical protein